MAFMSFTVLTQNRSKMLIIESMLAGHDIPGTMALGDTIHGNNNIEEQGTGEYDGNEDSGWNAFEREGADFGSNSLLGCLDGSFDYFGVFIFSCGVERNSGFNGFVTKRSELPVSIDLLDDETALLVHSTHSEETGQERFRFDVEEELSCSILDLSGNGVEEAKTIDPKHVHFEDNVLVVLDDCFRYVQNFREGWNAGLVFGFAAEIGHRGSVDCFSDSGGTTSDWVVSDGPIINLVEESL